MVAGINGCRRVPLIAVFRRATAKTNLTWCWENDQVRWQRSFNAHPIRSKSDSNWTCIQLENANAKGPWERVLCHYNDSANTPLEKHRITSMPVITIQFCFVFFLCHVISLPGCLGILLELSSPSLPSPNSTVLHGPASANIKFFITPVGCIWIIKHHIWSVSVSVCI